MEQMDHIIKIRKQFIRHSSIRYSKKKGFKGNNHLNNSVRYQTKLTSLESILNDQLTVEFFC